MGNTVSCNDEDGVEHVRSNRKQTVAELTWLREEEERFGKSDIEIGDYLKRKKQGTTALFFFFGVFVWGPYLWEVNRRFQSTKYYLKETDPALKELYSYAARVKSAEAAQYLLRQPWRFFATMPGPGSKWSMCCFGYHLYKYVENSRKLSEFEEKQRCVYYL